MNWLIVSIVAYFLNAISNIFDKFLLKKLIPEPAVFAFFVSLFGGLSLIFFPFDPKIPSLQVFLGSMLSGITFTLGILFLYKALKKGDASSVMPAVGGMTPVIILFLASVFLGENLGNKELIAFVFIILGSYFISKGSSGQDGIKSSLKNIIIASFFFATSHTLNKFVFVNLSFAAGMGLRGLGSLLGALLIFSSAKNRKYIKEEMHQPKKETGFIFFGSQACSSLGFILMNYAFALGSVALVSALSGLQYAFIFIFVLLLSKNSRFVEEEITPEIIKRKILSIILISVGMFLLF